ncbi:MAG: hypothetical protein JOZ13_06575 [Alphaproteobacteria bacterium]|nr:hypothetical protein [Alphaproteobacteria bacterium]
MKTHRAACLAVAAATFLLPAPGRADTDQQTQHYDLLTSCAAVALVRKEHERQVGHKGNDWDAVYGWLYDQARDSGLPARIVDGEISKKRKMMETGRVKLADQDRLCHETFARYGQH